tara:strand:- start:484 stop:801 length:318 start_codon:yes stop_codon:yes gene_type:complete
MKDEKKFSNKIDNISNDENRDNSKLNQDDTLKDLKDSLQYTIEDTSEIFNRAIEALESGLKDPEIRQESVEIVNNLNNEFKVATEQAQNKIISHYVKGSLNPEEE